MLFVSNKDGLKEFLKLFLIRLTGILIPVIIMLVYITYNGAFSDFVNYTIKGTTEFSNYIEYNKLIKLNITGVLSILVPLTMLVEWVKTIILEKDRKASILLVYGIAMFAIVFPISDKIHFLIGSIPIIILLLYEIRNIVNKIIKKKKIKVIFITFASSVLILGLIYYTGNNFYNYFKNINKYSNLNHFKYIPVKESLEKQIIEVGKWISQQENDVKIIDANAAVYMIPLDRYNKDYDMLNRGNLGKNGEQRIIEEISKNENEKYLILDNKYPKNWQTPTSIITYILNNKQKIGDIEIFNIYQ